MYISAELRSDQTWRLGSHRTGSCLKLRATAITLQITPDHANARFFFLLLFVTFEFML